MNLIDFDDEFISKMNLIDFNDELIHQWIHQYN